MGTIVTIMAMNIVVFILIRYVVYLCSLLVGLCMHCIKLEYSSIKIIRIMKSVSFGDTFVVRNLPVFISSVIILL